MKNMVDIKWCFRIKNGLKLIEPNKDVSFSSLDVAENTLSKIKGLIEEGDYLWASVRIYYCSYYLIQAFLQRIGIKSENHDCSIELTKFLLGKEFIDCVYSFKEDRIDSQYYLKISQKKKLLKNYSVLKEFNLKFREKIIPLNLKEIEMFRSKLRSVLE